mgnify:CR=1 FL=1
MFFCRTFIREWSTYGKSGKKNMAKIPNFANQKKKSHKLVEFMILKLTGRVMNFQLGTRELDGNGVNKYDFNLHNIRGSYGRLICYNDENTFAIFIYFIILPPRDSVSKIIQSIICK